MTGGVVFAYANAGVALWPIALLYLASAALAFVAGIAVGSWAHDDSTWSEDAEAWDRLVRRLEDPPWRGSPVNEVRPVSGGRTPLRPLPSPRSGETSSARAHRPAVPRPQVRLVRHPYDQARDRRVWGADQ